MNSDFLLSRYAPFPRVSSHCYDHVFFNTQRNEEGIHYGKADVVPQDRLIYEHPQDCSLIDMSAKSTLSAKKRGGLCGYLLDTPLPGEIRPHIQN